MATLPILKTEDIMKKLVVKIEVITTRKYKVRRYIALKLLILAGKLLNCMMVIDVGYKDR